MKQIIILLFALIPSALISQNTVSLGDSKSPKPNLSQLACIAGHWQGEAFGGITEEVWTAPLGDSMMGSFKLVVDNKTEFYEICQMIQEDETIMFRLKHFDGKLKGWEEKDECINSPLVRIEKNKVFFHNFTFEKVLDNELNIYVMLKNNNGIEEEMKFNYKLKN